MNMEEARLYCLKLERDRERSWRESRQGAFESSMLSLDEHMAKFDDPGKIATFSDGGKVAESIRNGGVETPFDVVESALSRLSKRDKAFARALLDGKRWLELRMPKATFYRRLKKVGAEVRLHPSKSSL